MPLARRRRLVEIAQAHGLPLIEDDAYFDLRFSGEHLPTLYSLDGTGLVIYLSTFSKIPAAGMRLGWAVAAPRLSEKLVLLKNDTGSNPFSQHVAEEFANTGELRAHIDSLIDVYRHKRDLMLGALEEHMPEGTRWSRPEGGFVWLTLPPGVDLARAPAEGAGRRRRFPARRHLLRRWPRRERAAPAFSFVDADDIWPGIERLGRTILQVMSTSDE